jgi:hypothetical protein
MPSFKLFTRPAWLMLDRFRSRSVVRQNTCLSVAALPEGTVPISPASCET